MTAAAQNTSAGNAAALKALMTIENEALAAQDLLALKHIAVNRPRALIKTGHILWVTRQGGDIKIDAISSQAILDKTTPFAQWMTRQLRTRMRRSELDDLSQWEFDNSSKNTPFTYPFTQAIYAPLSPDPRRGGLLFTRDHGFKDVDIPLVKRLAKIFGMAAMATKRKKRSRLSLNTRWALCGIASLAALALAIPVPMTTLAPAEIVAGAPYIITAPFEGVIEDILVAPNALVQKDTPLLQFVDTSYRNEFILAGKEESIADAKLRQAALTSFISETAKRDIAIAEAEKALASARQDYAGDRLSKTVITAPKTGLAIYSDPTDWRGRHVTTGEAIIQIADPADLRLRIEAPLSMGETLETGARIKVFLDNNPLNAFEAELISASFYAAPMPGGHMAYEAYGGLKVANKDPLPRIGTRGVAKIYGGKAPLGYWLFRRPITNIRQSFGL